MENENKTSFDPSAMPSASTNGNTTPSKINFAEIKNNKPLFYGIIGGAALLVIIIIIVIVVNSGKKLVCTKESEYAGVKETEKVVLKFKKDVPKVTRTVTYDYSNDNDTSEEDLKKQVEEFNKQKDEKTEGKYDIDIQLNGKILTMTVTYSSETFAELYKSTIDSLEDKSMDGYKKHFEKQKYSCK